MWHEEIINTCILRGKKPLAETWLNLQVERVDTKKLQELGIYFDLGYIVFEQGTQHPTVAHQGNSKDFTSCDEMPLLAESPVFTPD